MTKGEIRKRVEQVAKVIIFGGEFADIRQYAAETDDATGRPWGVSERQLWRYQQAAYALIEKQAEKTRDKVWARHVQQRRQMFALAMEAGDLGTALSIVKDEADLHGLYPVAGKSSGVTVAVQVNNNNAPRLTVDEFRRLPLEERLRILRGEIPPSAIDRIDQPPSP